MEQPGSSQPSGVAGDAEVTAKEAIDSFNRLTRECRFGRTSEECFREFLNDLMIAGGVGPPTLTPPCDHQCRWRKGA